LKGRKIKPPTDSSTRVATSGLLPWGLSNTAASAGDNVNELTAEIRVEMAIVTAN
jgi:hypothetical protein